MTYRTHLSPQLGAALPAAAERAFAAIQGADAVLVHAKSRTTETSVVELGALGRVIRKRWTWPRRRDRLKGALRTTWAAPSPARREFEALARLLAMPGGAFAPEPLGYAERREAGVLAACTLVVREIADSTDLARWLAATASERRRARVLTRLAERLRQMHDLGLVDFEMHPRNVLVAARTCDVFKVDCAKQRRRTGAASESDRARDLAALDVGLVRLATAAERARFQSAYGVGSSLLAAVIERRIRIDARESRRLPPAPGSAD